MPPQEAGTTDRRKFLKTGLASLLLVGCRAETREQATSALTQPEGVDPDNNFEQFEILTQELRNRGVDVQWNHPSSGPTKPLIIVSNSHLPEGATAIDPDRAGAMASEYRTLEFLVLNGMRIFALEGNPANIAVTPNTFLLKAQPNGRHVISIIPPQ